jgi:Holliday junction resolvasome RuvABC endonuclease subunit
MKFLTIDPSLTNTGLCLFEYETQKYVTKSLLREDRTNIAVLNNIYSQLKATIDKHPVSFVVVEGYAFAANTRCLTQLAELSGVIKLAIFQMGLCQITIGPGEWKKIMLSKGNLKKDQVRIEGIKLFPKMKNKPQDELDALLMAFAIYKFISTQSGSVYEELGKAGKLPLTYRSLREKD